jgi:hypothetical protein
MDRVCGASIERDTLSQSRCWCRGLFCGRGGVRMTAELRRDFKVQGHAASRAQFEEFLTQQDLFDRSTKGEKWRSRLDSRSASSGSSRSGKKPGDQSNAA